MDTGEIRDLIELISKSCFSTFEFEGEGFRIKLVKEPGATAAPGACPAPVPPAAPATEAAPARPADAEASADRSPEPRAEPEGVALRSPIVGTFYRASSPDAAPFVEIGARVHAGQVLCIVEAMKVMNEIEAEIDAEVLEVPVPDGQPVEYGEVLFRLRPLARTAHEG